MRAALVILVLLTLTAAVGPTIAQGEDDVRFERWYRVERGGAPIGWKWHTERREGDLIVTEEGYFELILVLGEERRYETSGRVTESLGGQVIAKSLTMNGRDVPNPMRSDWKRHGDWPETLEVMPDDVLGPSGTARFISKRIAAGAERIHIRRAASLSTSAFLDLNLYNISTCSAIIDEREIEGFCANWGEAETQLMMDARGYPISAEFSDGTRRFAFRATSKENATAPFKPTEGVETSQVNVYVGNSLPYSLPEWRFRISRIDRLPMPSFDPIGAYYAEIDDGAIIVSRGLSAIASPSHKDHTTSLLETELINFSRLSLEGSERGAPGSLDRAEALESVVRTRITKKSYALRLADAATAWGRREGDCTEHAVLLAAVLRREGIPARVVGGLVRTSAHNHLLIQHLWVQALVRTPEGRLWIDLDATALPAADLTDRIALGATGVTDDSVEDLVRRLGSLAGLLRVEALPPE